MAEDFKVGQFGKIGEHMVGYELSKRGWVIFYPPYDERTDIVAMKARCKKCKAPWDIEHRIACLNTKCKMYGTFISGINRIRAIRARLLNPAKPPKVVELHFK